MNSFSIPILSGWSSSYHAAHHSTLLVAMAEATAQYKAKDAEILKAHSNKFGIDVSETFSSNHEGGTGTGGTPVTPKKDGGVNDLL